MINVTRTFLPPIELYTSYVKRAFDDHWLTNRGQLVKELEHKLKSYLSVEHLTLTTNGTLPLQIAIKALKLKGEIITTPFSYVATTSSIVWEGCTPVFVDIHPEYLTIDEEKIEEKITSKTSAILATHVYGNPCAIERIQEISEKHQLKVIYDAAHCFGVKYKNKSIFTFGDVSTCSFHATKIFHTGEGGCWVTSDKSLHNEMYYLHNFGHDGPERFHGLGINAKMSELQAAMGLSVIDYMDKILNDRKRIALFYDDQLDCTRIRRLKIRENTSWNNHYYPVIFNSEGSLVKIMSKLKEENIFPRRYFYPSLTSLEYVNGGHCTISEEISSKILCLPMFYGLQNNVMNKICEVVNQNVL